ncbi:RecQ family ATP-dependent DNA helicase [Portibacter lacus]|uniref:ATP-dependent DNA helicase RecQ n=1 Tax=Portibacter lacus TaxID=1099794 RepID=A0AA37WEP9_9BACT|nr:RecQ family ATP-dependent DNA helicase [Portibacter lacus]GLR16335.1 ATP-dependent DNA helicase RecQ [Portibacter lacus]
MSEQADKYTILKKYWGYSEFRRNQVDIIDAVLEGHDTLGLMATGGGKSLCYQLPAMMKEGICIVISPLIALMEDQEKGLKSKGIMAESIHSGKSKKRQDEILDNCIYGKVKFLFLSPEKFHSKLAMARISQMKVSFFAIDEAHCISQWGHDFRPSYLGLTSIKEHFPDHHILALTATATQNVIADILSYLDFDENHRIFKSSFSRPNISISVVKSTRKVDNIIRFSKRIKGSKIVYARNKRHCKEIHTALSRNGITSAIYHADIPIKVRQERQQDWLENKIECIVCTSAFGMGIDKPDVRLVMHYDLPPSLEEYIQEIGRAGRDGQSSYAVMLFNNYDLQELEFHYAEGIPSPARIKEIYHELGTFLHIAVGDGIGKGYNMNTEQFLEKIKSNKIELKSALQTLEKNEYLSVSSSFFTSDKFLIKAGKSTLNNFLNQTSDLSILVKHLLRNYEGLLYGYVSVSLEPIRLKNKWSPEHLFSVIAQGVKQDIFNYIHDDGSEKITYLTERLPKSNLSLDGKALRQFYKAKKERFEAVVNYVLNEECRANQLLANFGEISKEPCGVCDYCKGAFETHYNEEEYNEARHLILSSLSKKNGRIDDLIELWPWNKQSKLKEILKSLLEKEEIRYEKNYFRLTQGK